MESSWEILKQAVETKGAKAVAHELGVSAPLLYKWCEEPATGDHDGSGSMNPLDRIQQIIKITGDERMVQWLCQQTGGFYSKNPIPRKPVHPLHDTPKILKEFSDLLDELAKSLLDAKIDPEEAKRIRKEWEDVKSHGEAVARACEQSSKPTSR